MKIKSAVVGLGFIGKTHAENHVTNDCIDLRAVVDANETLGRELAAVYGAAYFPTLDELLENCCDVDWVDICLPTWMHEEAILKCAAKGKHILCEKPLTFSKESFERIEHAIRTSGVTFMVAQALRFWPEYAAIYDRVQAGEFGRLKMLHASRLSETPRWSTWYRDPEKSGGALFDLMLHDLDFVQWLGGDFHRVSAVGTQSASGAWNHVQALIHFDSGLTACVEACNEAYGHYPFTMTFKLFGENRIADLAISAGHNLDELGDHALYLYGHDQLPQLCTPAQTDAYAAEIAYFAECVLQSKTIDRVSLESSRRTILLVLAVKEALETGKTVVVDP